MERGEWVNDHANFESFGTACLTLFRCATMESWVGLMEECSSGVCAVGGNGVGGCGGPWAVPYFCSFLVAVTTVLLQLFTAIIIQNFEEMESRSKWIVPDENIKEFFNIWKSISQDAHMSADDFTRVMQQLSPPLGVVPNGIKPRDGTLHNARMLRLMRCARARTDALARMRGVSHVGR